ncbi:hypothetical protein HHI36_006369 [Cryptolaemus montrouzieri]|uniref:Uncharacterized protein n=1 Tax=Cryptolaemus montrouzieri TaxID=559131 RepID=A0ABD2NYB1_9CUCU
MRDFRLIMTELNALSTKLTTLSTDTAFIEDDVAAIRFAQLQLATQVSQCVSSIEQHEKVLNDQETRLNQCESNITKLNDEVSTVNLNVTRLTQQSLMLKSNVESLNVASTPTIDSSEILARVRRSHNVIVSRVAEDIDPASDFNTVSRILELVVPSSSMYLVSSSRIGSENRREPRPILVSVTKPITAVTF